MAKFGGVHVSAIYIRYAMESVQTEVVLNPERPVAHQLFGSGKWGLCL